MSQAKKIVDYSKLDGEEFADNDDDDFSVDFSAPKRKSTKSDSGAKPEKKRRKDTIQSAAGKKEKTKRENLSDVIYDRDIQRALQQSLKNAEDDDDDDFKTTDKKSSKPKTSATPAALDTSPPVLVPVVARCTDLNFETRSPPQLGSPEYTDRKPVVLLNEVESPPALEASLNTPLPVEVGVTPPLLDELKNDPDKPLARASRTAAKKKTSYVSDSDESFSESDEVDDDDYDDDNFGSDDDFSCGVEKKNEKTAKGKPAQLKRANKAENGKKAALKENSKPKVKSKPKASEVSRSTSRSNTTSPASVTTTKTVLHGATGASSESKVVTSSTSYHSPIAPNTGVRSKVKWTPPGPAGSSCSSSQKSPGLGSPAGLRLGLSRHGRFKPLHPTASVNVQPR